MPQFECHVGDGFLSGELYAAVAGERLAALRTGDDVPYALRGGDCVAGLCAAVRCRLEKFGSKTGCCTHVAHIAHLERMSTALDTKERATTTTRGNNAD